MQLAAQALRILKSKYVITLLAFAVWMLFFDRQDFGLIMSRSAKLKALKQSEQQLSVRISDTKTELNLLKTDAASVEKYAREKFYMKKDNEDLFIVKTP